MKLNRSAEVSNIMVIIIVLIVLFIIFMGILASKAKTFKDILGF